MSHPKNTTTPSLAQLSQADLSALRHRFRAAHGAQAIARVLLEDAADLGALLETRDREGLLSALVCCTHDLCAFHEAAYYDAVNPDDAEGGAQ